MSSGDAVGEHTLRQRLDPASTALVIIDMQYASACRTTGFGRWLAEQGRTAEASYRFDRIEQLLVPNIARLLSHFREAGLPVVFVRLGAQMRGCRDLIPHLRDLELAFGNIEGEREYEILDELAPLPGEAVVTKLSASAFTSSGIEALLRNLGTRSLVLTGVSTSQCVDLTARDAADRGFHCLVVEDAVAEDREEWHDSTLEQFQRLFGRVAKTDGVLAELAGIPSP
ncbi:MAG: cysteine hydrolase [Actinomycetia bacterium]|nr:cysteine hydrolase [Actinomycetes bacterium]